MNTARLALFVAFAFAGCNDVDPAQMVDPGVGGGGAEPDMGSDDPFQAAAVCTSNTMWTRGEQGNARMHPGWACIDCHTASGGHAPDFALAGTLFPTAHEPDDCNGTNGAATGARVVITDATGKVLTLTPNTAGNFYQEGTIALPFTAKVTYNGNERVMKDPQMTGDCNSCHTQNGDNQAPGRILLP